MKDIWLTAGVCLLLVVSTIILRSISASLFPLYLIYILLSVAAFIIFSKVDFEIWSVFYKHFYFASLAFLLLPLLIGQVTRGAVRWVQVGPLTLQPTEIVRPFLLLFFANFFYQGEVGFRRFIIGLTYLIPALFLILIQPSLGVALLTGVGFLGVVLASTINKKILAVVAGTSFLLLPLAWQLLEPYQKSRILVLFSSSKDPLGAGYNAIQSMIAVGSGKILGRGLGEGVQTQLDFLPERHTDFIFASIAEELGLLGGLLVLFSLIIVLYRLIIVLEEAKNTAARAFISGVFLTLFAQTSIHIGMNMGLLPITGIPLPFVSAGGSSLLATMIMLGMVVGAKKL